MNAETTVAGRRAFLAAALALMAVLAAARPLSALYPPPVERDFFVSASVFRLSWDGDLDGKLILGNSRQIFYIPKPGAGYGFSLGLGYANNKGLWSLSFQRSSHSSGLQGREGGSSFNALEVDGKGYLLRGSRVRPYLQIGINLPWLRVSRGAETSTKTVTATYLGMGFNAGAGLAVHFRQKVFVSAGVVYRFLAFLYAKGEGEGRDVQNLYVDGDGPRWHSFLKELGLAWEIGLGFKL